MDDSYSFFYTTFLAVIRWVIPVVAVAIVALWYKTILAKKPGAKVYAALVGQDGVRMPITYFETSFGRKKTCDLSINIPTISRVNAVLTKTDSRFKIKDVSGHNNIMIDGVPLEGEGYIQFGETISFGGYLTKLVPPNSEDLASVREKKRRPEAPGQGLIVLLLSIFALLVGAELSLKYYDGLDLIIPASFLLLIVFEWVYYFINTAAGGSITVEIPVFFLMTLGFAVCATVAPSALLKEVLASVAGFAVFIILSRILKSINLTMKLRYAAGIFALVLLAVNLIMAQATFGAKNWIDLGFITIQPSEFVKVAFVFAGAATLEHLLTKRNFMLFLVMSAGCFGALALMKDFGTASIFFVTMLIIIFMRTGNILLIVSTLAAAVSGALLIIKIMPYITRRFETWGHAWENASDAGYQQTRTMVAIGSGGLLGVGGGNGNLHDVFAADTDLAFGLIFEEWGGIVALCALFIFVALAIYAIWMCRGVRSSYYAIAVCAAAGMFLFQTALNVFGSLDILPMTGVTMPFVSNGGSSVVASWGLLAFFKAADRQLGLKTPLVDSSPPRTPQRRTTSRGTSPSSGRRGSSRDITSSSGRSGSSRDITSSSGRSGSSRDITSSSGRSGSSRDITSSSGRSGSSRDITSSSGRSGSSRDITSSSGRSSTGNTNKH